MSGVTWSKGFFRTWVVLSATWVGAAILLMGPKTYSAYWHPVLMFEHDTSGYRGDLDMTVSPLALEANATVLVRAAQPGLDPVALQESAKKLVTFAKAQRDHDLERARIAWMATVVPPLALLAFGICVSWIARGFRHEIRR
jgi:hypothetical protein